MQTKTSGWKVILHDPEGTRNPIVDQASALGQDRLGPGDGFLVRRRSTRQGDFWTIRPDRQRSQHLLRRTGDQLFVLFSIRKNERYLLARLCRTEKIVPDQRLVVGLPQSPNMMNSPAVDVVMDF